MLPCVCSVIDHRGRQNVIRTSVTHSAAPHVPLFLFFLYVICDLLLNRRRATWNLFVKYVDTYIQTWIQRNIRKGMDYIQTRKI